MEKFLREWRQDALNKAQYESAIFIGDKLLAMTSTYAIKTSAHRLGLSTANDAAL
jgi:anaphase-promoting complex subunit 6